MMIIIMIMMTTRIWSWCWSRRNTFSWLKWVIVAEYRAELPHVRMIDTDDGSTKHFKHWNLLEFSVLHSEIQLSKVRFFLLSYGYVASISPSASQISLLKGFGFMIHWMIILRFSWIPGLSGGPGGKPTTTAPPTRPPTTVAPTTAGTGKR